MARKKPAASKKKNQQINNRYQNVENQRDKENSTLSDEFTHRRPIFLKKGLPTAYNYLEF